MRTRLFVLILLVALAARVGVLAWSWNHLERLLTPDSAGYVHLSRSLVEDRSFQIDGRCEINRTPGYPFLLAFSAAWGDSWWRAAAAVQVLLDVLLVHLTFLLGWMLLGNDRAGLVAAAFQATSPLAIAASVRILSDSLFAFMLTLSLLLVVYHLRSGRRWGLAAGAVVLGLACYVRPVGLVFAAICVLVLLFRPRRLARAGMFAGIVAVCLAPWIIRNATTAAYTGFSSFAGDSAYYFATAELIAADEGKDPAEARDELKEIDERENAGKAPGPAAGFRLKLAMQTIVERPWLYAKTHLKGCLGFFLPGSTDLLEVCGVTTGGRGTLDVLHKEGPLAAWRHYFIDNYPAMVFAAATIVILAAQYLGVILCILRRLAFSMPAEAWLLGLVVIAAMLLPGPFGLPRYRIPVEPLLAVAAGAGFTRKRRRRIPAPPALGQ
jgi:4-amino-4-deoxy-L-arabinose transferase-like glycosyltransferase